LAGLQVDLFAQVIAFAGGEVEEFCGYGAGDAVVGFIFGGGAAKAVAGVAGGWVFAVGVEGFAEDCEGVS